MPNEPFKPNQPPRPPRPSVPGARPPGVPNPPPRPGSARPGAPNPPPPRPGSARPGVSNPPPPRPGSARPGVPGTPGTRPPSPAGAPRSYRETVARDTERRAALNNRPTGQETSVFKPESTDPRRGNDLGHTQKFKNAPQGVPPKMPGQREPEPEPETAPPEQKRGRFALFSRRRRARTGCLRGALYFVLVVFASIYLAVFAWGCVNDVLALIRPEGEVVITVPENFTVAEVAQQLHAGGVISHTWLFNLYVRHTNSEEIIEPGTFIIDKQLDYRAIVRSMRHRPEREVVSITFPEGLNVNQTIDLLVENGVSNREDLELFMSEKEFGFSFLEGIPEGPNRMEGFLFPDKYDFFTNEGARNVLNKFLRNFDRKLPPSVRRYIDETSPFTLHEIVTIASMIQHEAANVAEMRYISSVIHNRLRSNNFPYLEIDATIVHIIGREPGRQITAADINAGKEIDSPFNTFMHPGLPPGPICSPSLEAIRAATYPARSNYYFYLLTDAGVHEFTRTYAEFQAVMRRNPITYPQFAN